MPGPRPSPMSRLTPILVAGALIGVMALMASRFPCPARASESRSASTLKAGATLNRQLGCFVPNLGQWDHSARFVHRSGPMTLFLEDRGWVLDLVERPVRPRPKPHEPASLPRHERVDQKVRGVALKMTFEDARRVTEIVGEEKLPGHHHYFLGNDESRWKSPVPLYGSVRYRDLYPGVDLRVREAHRAPESQRVEIARGDLHHKHRPSWAR